MEAAQPFDWYRIWFGNELPVHFLFEVILRSVIMYLLILGTLRVTGKRGVKQLSLFELTIILSLGSAAGDPMFYEDVPLFHVFAVFGVVIGFYLLVNYLSEKYEKMEVLLEGSPDRIIVHGKINLQAFKNQNLTYQELFGEMRQQHIEHLGQVKTLYLEATGEISIFFFEDEAVQPGLPILPELLASPLKVIIEEGNYACKSCGHVANLQAASDSRCPECGKSEWLAASTARRIT